MPKKANGSLPTIIKPINTSLKTDRKDAMCLLKDNKQKRLRRFPVMLHHTTATICLIRMVSIMCHRVSEER